MADRGFSKDKKTAEEEGATLVFLDESGFMLTPTVRRTFAPRGKTPIMPCWERHDRITAISAITLSPERNRLGLYFELLPDNTNATAEAVVRFLRQIRSQIQRRMIVIWDRHNIHDRAMLVRKFLARNKGVSTEKLPAYAPELNPDEQVWTHTKYARLANLAPSGSDDMRRRLARELRIMRKRPRLLASFLDHTKLAWSC